MVNTTTARFILMVILCAGLAACYEDKAVVGNEDVKGPLVIASQDKSRQRELEILFGIPAILRVQVNCLCWFLPMASAVIPRRAHGWPSTWLAMVMSLQR